MRRITGVGLNTWNRIPAAALTALEQRRDRTRALKQGIMQELLIGRTRLL